MSEMKELITRYGCEGASCTATFEVAPGRASMLVEAFRHADLWSTITDITGDPDPAGGFVRLMFAKQLIDQVVRVAESSGARYLLTKS
jgi:hypothetical protein